MLTSLVATPFKRAFSATAKALIKFVWDGTTAHPTYENIMKDKMKKNPKLAGADEVKFAYAPRSVFPYPCSDR